MISKVTIISHIIATYTYIHSCSCYHPPLPYLSTSVTWPTLSTSLEPVPHLGLWAGGLLQRYILLGAIIHILQLLATKPATQFLATDGMVYGRFQLVNEIALHCI